MINFLKKICHVIDAINERIGRSVSWLTAVLVVLVTVDVALRYLFKVTFVASQELEWHLFALVFLLGGGYTLRHNGHVRVDVFYQRLGRKGKALVNILGCLIFLFPGSYLVIKTSLPFVHFSWSISEASPNPGGLPARYLLKGAIPVAFSLMALQGLSLLSSSILVLLGQDPKRKRA